MDMFLIFNHIQISPKSILYTLWGLRGYNAGHRSDVFFKEFLNKKHTLDRLASVLWVKREKTSIYQW